MRIDLHPVARLRGKNPLDVTAALSPVIDAISASSEDLTRVNVVCDWIQYRSNFRQVADYRPVLATPWRSAGQVIPGPADPASGPEAGSAEIVTPETALEIAIDLRRAAGADLRAAVSEMLAARARPGGPGGPPGVPLEPWTTGRHSCIWRFNALYWQALSSWEQSSGHEYEQALPGGESDARNRDAARDLILELFKTWDDLDVRSALPAELYVAELGVGNGNQASTWLDEFVELSRAHSRDYYRRLHYIMCDYSPHVLARARKTVARHGDHVSTLVVDATHPAVSLGFLRGKAFLVYISNVYDNLPCDEVAQIGGLTYLVQTRAYLPGPDAARIARDVSATPEQIAELAGKLLRLGPELLAEAMPQHFTDIGHAVTFWRDVWEALRLAERYRPLEGLDGYEITPELTGDLLRPQLESHGDIRVHVSNGALSSFAETLPLLHPFGRLQCHDLFLEDAARYHSGFFGPGKYDGSVVNWVNGPLLRLIGGRAGFDVRIAPFAARPSSNVRTLTVAVRE
jgi:hypothetical protein